MSTTSTRDDSNDGGAQMYALLRGAGEEDKGEMRVIAIEVRSPYLHGGCVRFFAARAHAHADYTRLSSILDNNCPRSAEQ